MKNARARSTEETLSRLPKGDYNGASVHQLKLAKNQMNQIFQQKVVKPTDANYVYNKQVSTPWLNESKVHECVNKRGVFTRSNSTCPRKTRSGTNLDIVNNFSIHRYRYPNILFTCELRVNKHLARFRLRTFDDLYRITDNPKPL